MDGEFMDGDVCMENLWMKNFFFVWIIKFVV